MRLNMPLTPTIGDPRNEVLVIAEPDTSPLNANTIIERLVRSAEHRLNSTFNVSVLKSDGSPQLLTPDAAETVLENVKLRVETDAGVAVISGADGVPLTLQRDAVLEAIARLARERAGIHIESV